jgi:hypothetical protein
MNIEARKLQFIEEYIRLQNEIIIEKLFLLLKKETSKATIILSATEKKAADKAIKSLEKGKKSSHEVVMGRMKNKFPQLNIEK